MKYGIETCHPQSANPDGKARRRLLQVVGATLGFALVPICLASCGGDFIDNSRGEPRPTSPGEPHGQYVDAGYERNHDGGAGIACVDQPWALSFEFSLDANGSLTHARADLLPASHLRLTTSVSSVAQGAPGSENLLAASLTSADGSVLSQDLFNDPRFADAGVGRNRDHDLTDLALQLLPGTRDLVITNWNTGAVLFDLDLHGDLQLLCLNQPCLDICANPDAGTPAPDSGADLSVAGGEGDAG